MKFQDAVEFLKLAEKFKSEELVFLRKNVELAKENAKLKEALMTMAAWLVNVGTFGTQDLEALRKILE